MTDFSVIPCASQKRHMEDLGFQFQETTHQPDGCVCWLGHGIAIKLPETHEIESPAAAMTLAVIEALAAGELRIRNQFRELVRLPSL